MKSVAWVIADREKTAKEEEGVDGLGAAALDCLFPPFSAVWSLRGQPGVEHTPGSPSSLRGLSIGSLFSSEALSLFDS